VFLLSSIRQPTTRRALPTRSGAAGLLHAHHGLTDLTRHGEDARQRRLNVSDGPSEVADLPTQFAADGIDFRSSGRVGAFFRPAYADLLDLALDVVQPGLETVALTA
jgi:hypothetical protein